MADFKTVPLSPEEERAARNLFPADPKKDITPVQAQAQLKIARDTYRNVVEETNRVISNSTPLTTGFPGMVAGLPGISLLTDATRAGTLRQNVGTVKSNYGLGKVAELNEAGVTLAPFTEKEMDLVASTAGAMNYGGTEAELDRQATYIQKLARDAYLRELEAYKALYGKPPEGYAPSSKGTFPTIRSLPGFKPRKPTRP